MGEVTYRQVIALLGKRHNKDVFVPECKDGASHGRIHRRLDAWAMRRSWSHPCLYGYEIKMTRRDFLSDEKYHHYLPLCNVFSFVCPKGVINVEEIPPEAGLSFIASTGTRLYTKKKAPFRSIEHPRNLFIYLLMARTQVIDSMTPQPRLSKIERTAAWLEYLDDKKNIHQIGHMLSTKISDNISRIEHGRREAERKVLLYTQIEERLKELGFEPGDHVSTWSVDHKLEQMGLAVSTSTIRALEGVLATLQRGIDKLKKQIK